MTLALEQYEYDSSRCIRCKGCMWVDHIYMSDVRFGTRCPSVTKYSFDAYGAYGRLKLALALMKGEITYTPRLLDIIYQCNFCGACDVGCKRNLDLEVLSTFEALRIRCVQDGSGPMPEHKRIAENIASTHNRYKAAHENRLKWLPVETKLAARADYVYFVGCAASHVHQEISQATAKILNSAGIEYTVMPDEWCCGNPLYTTGQLEAAKKAAAHNIEAIQKTGAGTVLTSCAECYKVLKVDYPKMLNKSTADMGFKVLHIVELVDELLKQGKLEFSGNLEMKVTYHDACNLARLSEPWIHWEGKHGKWGLDEPPKEYRRGTHGVYQQPRDILQNIIGIELVEMIRMRENAWCCGAGGGVRDAFKDFALWSAGERLEEVKVSGAEAIVSCCPYCKDNLTEAINIRDEKLKVYDITELISQAITPG